jgi:hypothetical protein
MANMAAAIVPLVISGVQAAYPILAPFIQAVIVHLESLHGAKTGSQVKLPAAVAAVTPVANSLSTAGKFPLLTSDQITAMVESSVQQLKATGILNPDTASAIAASPLTPVQNAASFSIKSGTLQLTLG